MEYTLVERAEDLGPLAERIARAEVIAVDIETYDPVRGGGSLDPITGEIRLIQLNLNGEPDGIFVIDLMQTGTLGPVEDAFRDTKAVFIAHNAKFEQKWFQQKYGMKLWPLFCTFRASAILHNGRNMGHGLWDLYERELGIKEHPPDMAGSDWSKPNLTKAQLDYAVDDVVHLPELRKILKKKLAESGLLLTALIEFGAILPEGEIELNGFGFDKEGWLALAKENKQRAFDMAEALFEKIPHPSGQIALPGLNAGWNLGSPKQMLSALNGMGIDVENTREATLSMVAGQHPIVKEILAHRKTAKQVTSFGPDFLKYLHPETGRIHTSFYAMLAAGRYSSSKPNLQQIPRDPRFRKCFAAAPGRCLVAADYSGIEMRIVAEISGDGELIRVFLDNEDAHKATAAIVKGKPVDQVTKDERQIAKPVNFGLIYGMEAASLVLYAMSGYGVAMTKREAQNYIDRFFGRYEGIKRWHDRVMRDGRRSGISRTLSGRLRYLDPEKAWNEFKNCLDEKTEALTSRGWVPGMDLHPGDVLLTKNIETGKLEWQPATDVRKWPDYEGELIEFRSRSFNAVSTPDHRWMVTDKHSGEAVCKVTDEISVHGDHRIHRTGDYDGAVTSEFSDAEVELFGWLVTDGSIFPVNDRGGRPKVVLSQSQRAKPQNVSRIDAAMGLVGWGHSRHVAKGSDCVTWHLHKDVSASLAAMFPGRLLSVDFLRKLTRSQLALLLDTMIAGDGHVEPDSGKTSFYTGTEESAAIFQILVTMNGFAANVTARDMSKYSPKSEKLRNVPKMGTCYVVTVLRRNTAQLQKPQKTRRHSKEPIWCPIVPNTYFVARREGQVFVTGNTPVQGTGADALKTSMCGISERLAKHGDAMKMVHIVHDEVILEVDDDPDCIKAAESILHDEMKVGMEKFLKVVPVVVDPAHGRTWADVH